MLSRQLLGSILNPSIKYLKLAALMAAVFAHGPLIAEQMDSAYDLMARMAKASKELSYKGLFTYEYRGQLRSIKVVHLVRDGKTYELGYNNGYNPVAVIETTKRNAKT